MSYSGDNVLSKTAHFLKLQKLALKHLLANYFYMELDLNFLLVNQVIDKLSRPKILICWFSVQETLLTLKKKVVAYLFLWNL